VKIAQYLYTRKNGWDSALKELSNARSHWVIVFGERELVQSKGHIDYIIEKFPDAIVMCGSTAGEIHHNRVYDNSLAITAVEFEKSSIKAVQGDLSDYESSFEAGKSLATQLKRDQLRHVFVLSDGVNTNATDLINGIYSVVDESIIITGGLCGDGAGFKETTLGINGNNQLKQVVLIGFYGEHLEIGYGSKGGWIPFGPKRKVTKAIDNVLYELDHQSALDLYKLYLKDQANELPASGLLFPLSLVDKTGNAIVNKSGNPIVRTLVAVNHDDKSLTFAGDIPEGCIVQMMQASTEDLILGAVHASKIAMMTINESPELVIMISCVGRKLIMGQQSEEEIEEVIEQFNAPKAVFTGFYSYGEICPFFISQATCQKSLLHNQTMTITTIREV
jgi:hypothetical protein